MNSLEQLLALPACGKEENDISIKNALILEFFKINLPVFALVIENDKRVATNICKLVSIIPIAAADAEQHVWLLEKLVYNNQVFGFTRSHTFRKRSQKQECWVTDEFCLKLLCEEIYRQMLEAKSEKDLEESLIEIIDFNPIINFDLITGKTRMIEHKSLAKFTCKDGTIEVMDSETGLIAKVKMNYVHEILRMNGEEAKKLLTDFSSHHIIPTQSETLNYTAGNLNLVLKSVKNTRYLFVNDWQISLDRTSGEETVNLYNLTGKFKVRDKLAIKEIFHREILESF